LPPGEAAEASDYDPGDFILTHGSALYSKLIRFGQALPSRGPDGKYAWWNHAAMVVSASRDLVEALGPGVEATHIDDYKLTEHHLVRLGSLADIDRPLSFEAMADDIAGLVKYLGLQRVDVMG
jgi:hypothetical protein